MQNKKPVVFKVKVFYSSNNFAVKIIDSTVKLGLSIYIIGRSPTNKIFISCLILATVYIILTVIKQPFLDRIYVCGTDSIYLKRALSSKKTKFEVEEVLQSINDDMRTWLIENETFITTWPPSINNKKEDDSNQL